MTDEEKIKAVTAKLTGGFYVGQRVRHKDPEVATKWTGVVRKIVGPDVIVLSTYGSASPRTAHYEAEWFEPFV